MPDITMNVDDTLELDTIIENSSRAKEPITITDGKDYNLSGFQTHTGVFDPQSSGDYTIKINGQKLTIKVNESIKIPNTTIDDFEDGNISEYSESGSGNAFVDSFGYIGSNSLSNKQDSYIGVSSVSGLNTYPSSQGDWIRAYCYGYISMSINSDGGFNSGSPEKPRGHNCRVDPSQNTLELATYSSNNTSYNSEVSFSGLSASEWYILDMKFRTDNVINAEVIDLDGNTIVNDTRSSSSFTNENGVGFEIYNSNSYVDSFYILENK